MMNNIEEVCKVIAALHDGAIESCEGTYEALWVKVGCTYLAELIEKEFDYFYLRLLAVKKFDFEEYGGQIRQLYNTNDLTDIDIELLSSEIDSECVKTYCTKGILWIQCESIEIFDHNERAIVASELYNLAALYWSKKK